MRFALCLFALAAGWGQIDIKPVAAPTAPVAEPVRAAIGKQVVERPAIAQLESSFEGRIDGLDPNTGFQRLGATSGFYLNGYGVVFATPMDLINTPRKTPFMDITPLLKEKVYKQKIAHLPMLRGAMHDALVAAANSLTTLPQNQKIVMAVRLFYYDWENRAGLPSQIIMSADRASALADRIATEEQ